MTSVIRDLFGRPLRSLRVSITDRCNLRCRYCMPEEEYSWLPREDLLSIEELERMIDVFLDCGVDKIRLTGGEPLLRRDVCALIARLATKPQVQDLALTTNGVLLEQYAEALQAAGLQRVTVSLDSLYRDRFHALTRRDALDRVIAGIDAVASRLPLKIDTVLMRDVNDDELIALIEFGRRRGAEVRFIEYMDVGGATHWSITRVVSRDEVLERLVRHFGAVEPIPEDTSAPADRYRLPDGTVFGIIASVTQPFCDDCDRSRLTADGMWYRCLYAPNGFDLRRPLRAGTPAADLAALVRAVWEQRSDRGAEARLAARHRTPFIPLEALRRDPHLEMHTRGG